MKYKILIYLKKFIKAIWKYVKVISEKLWQYIKILVKTMWNFLVNLTLKDIMVGLFVLISILMLFDNQVNEEGLSKVYYEISETLAQEPYKSNTDKGDYSYYIPKGYKQIEDSNVYANNETYMEIIFDISKVIGKDQEFYELNNDMKILYKNSEVNSKGELNLGIVIWEVDEFTYESLIVDENNHGVVIKTPKKDFRNNMIEAGDVLSSIK